MSGNSLICTLPGFFFLDSVMSACVSFNASTMVYLATYIFVAAVSMPSPSKQEWLSGLCWRNLLGPSYYLVFSSQSIKSTPCRLGRSEWKAIIGCTTEGATLWNSEVNRISYLKQTCPLSGMMSLFKCQEGISSSARYLWFHEANNVIFFGRHLDSGAFNKQMYSPILTSVVTRNINERCQVKWNSLKWRGKMVNIWKATIYSGANRGVERQRVSCNACKDFQ